MKELRIVTLGFGTGRQKMALERWTKPTLSRRACTCEYGIQSCRGKSAGVVKRPRELISHPKSIPNVTIRGFSIAVFREVAPLTGCGAERCLCFVVSGGAVPFLSEGELPLHLRGEDGADDAEPTPPSPSAAPAAAAAATPPAAAASVAVAAAAAVPDEAAIATLVGLGFPRQQAVQALESTNGNVDLAASMLFN
jgi:hypothetical protein